MPTNLFNPTFLDLDIIEQGLFNSNFLNSDVAEQVIPKLPITSTTTLCLPPSNHAVVEGTPLFRFPPRTRTIDEVRRELIQDTSKLPEKLGGFCVPGEQQTLPAKLYKGHSPRNVPHCCACHEVSAACEPVHPYDCAEMFWSMCRKCICVNVYHDQYPKAGPRPACVRVWCYHKSRFECNKPHYANDCTNIHYEDLLVGLRPGDPPFIVQSHEEFPRPARKGVHLKFSHFRGSTQAQRPFTKDQLDLARKTQQDMADSVRNQPGYDVYTYDDGQRLVDEWSTYWGSKGYSKEKGQMRCSVAGDLPSSAPDLEQV